MHICLIFNFDLIPLIYHLVMMVTNFITSYFQYHLPKLSINFQVILLVGRIQVQGIIQFIPNNLVHSLDKYLPIFPYHF